MTERDWNKPRTVAELKAFLGALNDADIVYCTLNKACQFHLQVSHEGLEWPFWLPAPGVNQF